MRAQDDVAGSSKGMHSMADGTTGVCRYFKDGLFPGICTYAQGGNLEDGIYFWEHVRMCTEVSYMYCIYVDGVQRLFVGRAVSRNNIMPIAHIIAYDIAGTRRLRGTLLGGRYG